MKKIIAVLFVSMLLLGSTGLLGFVQRASAAETLTISGWIQHKNESGTLVDSRYIKVEAWEKQAIPLADYEIAEGYTDDTGHFTFTQDTNGNTILNEDPGLGESGTRDIYIKCFAENEAARVSNNWLNGILGAIWSAETTVHYDVAGPTWDISIDIEGDNSPAFGIPALIKADRDWLSSRTGGWTRDRLDVLYPDTDWPNFFGIWVYNVMRIPDGWADRADTISHEYGHGIHYSTRDGNWPLIYGSPTGEEDPKGWPIVGSGSHWIYSESSDWFALTEGWAEFFAAARHGDHWSLSSNDYWMGADGSGNTNGWRTTVRGPNTDGNTGEIDEGAFASILWNLYTNGYFSNAWTVFKNDQPDRVWSSSANDDFYHYWISRFGETRAVDEIFIDHGIKVADDQYDSGIGNDDSAHTTNLGMIDSSKKVQDLIVVDPDWYTFTTSGQGDTTSNIIVDFEKTRGNLDLFVYRSDGTLVGTGTEFSRGKWVSLNGENAGTFKVEVVGTHDNSATTIYEGDFSPHYDLTIALRTRSSSPDYFGYSYLDSNSLTGPAYNWIEISGTGTEVLPSSDDSWIGNIGLGFFFNYYGTDYSQLAIGNNGLLFSGVGTSQYVNDPIMQSPSIHSFIAPYWDDIVTWGSAGAVYYQTLGTAPNRQFVVEWYDNQHYYSSTSGITFEAILYEGSDNILFQYKDVDFGTVSGSTSSDLPPYNNGGSATVGIEDPTGNIGLQYSFDEQVINPGLAILFKFPAFVGTNMHLSMNAPVSMDHGNTMSYTLYYNDFGDTAASSVVLQTTLSSDVDFVSASDAGTYDSTTRTVTWNIGTVPAFPSGRGSTTITATIPASIPIGTIIQTTASISTSTLETRYDDNTASVQTTVTGSSLPPNVGVGPTLGNSGGIPSVNWGTPITFTYYDSSATAIDIRIHLSDGGPDITGSMTGGPPLWSFTVTFYPRHGQATVTYTVHGPTTQSISFNIYVDPAGYIYNVVTLQRVSGASVWLQRSDGQGGWENVPTGQNPPIMQPDANPLITGADGQYQWDVLAGSYRVHVEAPGYYPADSIVVTVPPAVTDLHVGLTPLPSPADDIPPATVLTRGNPEYCDPSGNVYVTSSTPFTLTAEDNVGGSGVATTGYRIRACDLTYDSGWTCCAPPTGFYLTGIADGSYFIDYNSTDNSANTEATNTVTVILDNTPPTTSLTIDQPKYSDASNNIYVSSATPFTLIATDNLGGTGVVLTSYRIYNNTYSEGWQAYSTAFYLTSLQDGTYFIDYNSTDAIGNVEPKNTATVILDTTPPTTNLNIGYPKYVSSRTYVTPDTPFTLIATDTGSGVKLTTYRINSTNYDSGWLTYTQSFKLFPLADGNYTIAFNSTDNVGNVETTHRTDVTLFSWNHVFKDSDGRGTTLKICTAYKFFQFIAPDKDFGIKYTAKMTQLWQQVTITCYEDSQMRLMATALDDKTCVGTVCDKQTGKTYWLIEHPPTYKLTICCKDLNGKAISGASVYLNGCCKGQTDSNGNLIITNVLAGTYTVTVKKCGYKDSSSTTTVTGDATLTITMIPQTYTLTVCCKDSKGKAISGVSVYVNSIYRGTSDQNGKLVINNITGGTHTVKVQKTGYKDTSVNVIISSDKTVTITMK